MKFVVLWSAAIGMCIAACALFSDPRAANYGVERMACVTENDAAAPARACMHAVDVKYGQTLDAGDSGGDQ